MCLLSFFPASLTKWFARNLGIQNVSIPLLCTTLTPGTPLDWNYTTTPQVGFNGRSVIYPRGKVLGGSSSVSEYARPFRHYARLSHLDFMGYTRGPLDDYNRYAAITKDPGWSWDQLMPYILKVSRLLISWYLKIL